MTSVKINVNAESLVGVHTHTHTHTHTSSLEIKNKRNKLSVLKLNKIYKKSRNIISCEYIDTSWYYLLVVMGKIKIEIKRLES